MSTASQTAVRPRWQLSLRQMLVGVTLVALLLGIYKTLGPLPLVHYVYLLFAVGPWFAYLASESLPCSRSWRSATANLLLLVLFGVTLKLAEHNIGGNVVLVVGLSALMLWTPQYLLFLVWRQSDEVFE